MFLDILSFTIKLRNTKWRDCADGLWELIKVSSFLIFAPHLDRESRLKICNYIGNKSLVTGSLQLASGSLETYGTEDLNAEHKTNFLHLLSLFDP